MTPDDLTTAILTSLASAGADYCRPSIPSRTLQSALIVQVPDPNHALIFLSHYWALYVHDGRQPFVKSTIMCWFRDPKADPRLNNGVTPERVSQLRHLTASEFKYWVAQNRAAERAVYGRLRKLGEPQVGPMIITTEIRNPTQASNFFENTGGMAGFSDTTSKYTFPIMTRHIEEELVDVLHLKIPLDFHIA